MKQETFNQALFIGGILTIIFLALSMTACSVSMLMKECSQVESQDYYKCKTLKPWE